MNAPWYHSNLGGRYAAFLKRSLFVFFCRARETWQRETRDWEFFFRFFHQSSSSSSFFRFLSRAFTKENEATSPSLFHRCSCWQTRWKWEGFWSGLGGSSQRFFFFFFFFSASSSTTTKERGCWGKKRCCFWWNGEYRCVHDDRRKKKGWLLEEESGEEHYSMAWICGIVFVLFLSTK